MVFPASISGFIEVPIRNWHGLWVSDGHPCGIVIVSFFHRAGALFVKRGTEGLG